MQVGLMVPQGWKGEYAGWSARDAWARSIELAVQVEQLGFESAWLFDHFHTVPEPTDEITFESFTMLGAIAQATRRIRLGHMVVCTAFRNPALTAKMASTLDVISDGRFELGLGAGWKEDEWVAYGYEFPSLPERLAIFADHLQVVTRMLLPGRASFEGRYANVRGAINEPKGIQQPRIPIVVGGNGPNVTWRLAARFADELNIVYLTVDEVAEALPVIRERCLDEGRDPATLRLSLYARDPDMEPAGQARVDVIGQLAELGLDRLVVFLGRRSVEPDAQAGLAEDVLAAGIELTPNPAPTTRRVRETRHREPAGARP